MSPSIGHGSFEAAAPLTISSPLKLSKGQWVPLTIWRFCDFLFSFLFFSRIFSPSAYCIYSRELYSTKDKSRCVHAVCHSLHHCLSLAGCLCVSFCLCLSVCLSACLSLSLFLSLFLSLSLSLSLFLSATCVSPKLFLVSPVKIKVGISDCLDDLGGLQSVHR